MVARPESPTVDRPLKPVTVTEGETAKFMVKMHGEPPPTVTWYINDVPVSNVSQASYLPSASSLTSSCILVINVSFLKPPN